MQTGRKAHSLGEILIRGPDAPEGWGWERRDGSCCGDDASPVNESSGGLAAARREIEMQDRPGWPRALSEVTIAANTAERAQ